MIRSDENGVYVEPRPVEERAEVASLDALHARRRALINANARLFALYGPFGHYDDHRKHMVEALKIKARLELSAGQEKKPTETAIDAAAYGSEQYGAFIDTALGEKVEYLRVSTEITEIEEAIRSREFELTAYSRELSLR
jgi:hypothetical protein